ncbi:MAG TPA: LamG-like jellyroll fold domain-containing protein [Bryobacteraceae bacterium]
MAQLQPNSSFCTLGIQPDGFVDWFKLPAPPASGGVNAAIPVTGIPGLTATLQIANTTTFSPNFKGYYQVANAAALALPLNTNPTIMFSKPVKGVSVMFQAGGRFGYNFQMTAYNNAGQMTSVGPPPPANVDGGGFEVGPGFFNSVPLEIRSMNADIAYVKFTFNGDPEEFTGGYSLINFRIESGSAPDPALAIPTAGMREWLRADKFNLSIPTPEGITQEPYWPDQSGHGSDATPVATNGFVTAAITGSNCTPAVIFSTASSALTFNLPINGWTGMTVFMAGQAYTDAAGWWQNQALMWNESEPWGTTFFTPSESNVFFRFGTTQVNNQPIHPRVVNAGGDFTVTTAEHNGTVDSLWVNGQLALRQGGKEAAIAGTLPNALIGSGLLGTYFSGNIGEVIIYDRALTDAERETVQHYLTAKYGTH